MGRIEWLPMGDMPDEIRDGRPILGFADGDMAVVAYERDEGYWRLMVVGQYAEDGEWHPTHWAEINPPGDVEKGIPVYKPRDATDDVLPAEKRKPLLARVKGKSGKVYHIPCDENGGFDTWGAVAEDVGLGGATLGYIYLGDDVLGKDGE